MFFSVITGAAIVLSKPGFQVARRTRVVRVRIVFAEEDINIKEAFHWLACQAVVMER